MKNQQKIILDLCGGTGSWSNPYKNVGYDVRVITLPKYDINVWWKYPEIIQWGTVYGILAAPPCTHFSLARTTARTPRDLRGAMEIVNACLNIIWEHRYRNKLKFWALENPMGYLRQFLGKPPLTFDPFEYGAPYTKKTDLWGYYNTPKKTVVKLTDQQMRDCSINNRILPKIPEGYSVPKDMKIQTVRRSITPEGFAQAFFESNK